MSFLATCGATLAAFCLLAATFRPIEWAFPARPGQRFFRPDWTLDLCYFIGQYLLWVTWVVGGLSMLRAWIDGIAPSTFRAAVASQPWWLQVGEVILLSDVSVYWAHRLQHRVEWLWRFHAIHHSAEHLDWLAAHREHPVDTVYNLLAINLPVFLMGFPVETISGLVAFRGLWAIYIHSNVRLPLGPLDILLGSPELHHWHHDRRRDAGNYSNLSPLMDVLFGTYHCPEPTATANSATPTYGINGQLPRSYLGQLWWPFARWTRVAR